MWLKPTHKRIHHQPDENFQNDLIYALKHCSMHCYSHLSAWNTRSKLEFLMWLVIHITDIIILIYITISAKENFNASPILTSLYDTLYPISKINFPAVNLCNINRISRKAAMDFATELAERDPDPDKNQAYFMQNILYLGKLYDYDLEQGDNFSTEHFQKLLENYFSDNSTEINNVERLLYRLAPKCEDILIRCFWESVEFECLDQVGMIEVKLTSVGTCCTFNYLKPVKPHQEVRLPHVTNLTGPDVGLILVVNGSSDDYYYPIANSIGFKLQIFQPTDMPSRLGGMIETKIDLGMEVFVRVSGIPIITTNAVRDYSIDTRKCLFQDELSEKFPRGYERGECIVKCRKRSMSVLCGCLPFFYATSEADEKFEICNLQHIRCMHKYKIKWYTLTTELAVIEGLEKEMEESLYCPDCLPSCSHVTYQVSTSELPLIESKRGGFGLIRNIRNVSDVTIIRIFFGQSHTWLYKQDVAMYWFEILSNFGGIFGVLSGVSFVSACEVIYFILKHLFIFIHHTVNLNFKHFKQLTIYP